MHPLGRGSSSSSLRWLLGLRWGALLGQTLAAFAAELLLQLHVPLWPIATLLGMQLASNVVLAVWAKRTRDVAHWVSASILALDFVFLTLLLLLSGGAANPFTVLYIVNIALACVLLPPRYAWTIASLALACFAALFANPQPIHMHGDGMTKHLQGMWLAFALAAMLVVYFVTRVSRLLAERERALDAARAVAARHEKLAALATLAAGAAHELSTPLSTIAVVAQELSKQLAVRPQEAESAEDARLIRDEVARCRDILARLAHDAGQPMGEAASSVSWGELASLATAELPPERIAVTLPAETHGIAIRVPARTFAQAVQSLLKNALDAAPTSRVELAVRRDSGTWLLDVRDNGPGIPDDVLARVGEPFFTTKPEGKGMGLGFFVARGVIESMGGTLELRSQAGTGTRATVRLPTAEQQA